MSCDLFSGFKITNNRVIELKEGILHEFKESFNWAGREQYARVMASFANSSGGYLIFGIKDDGSFIGLSNYNFENRDPADISLYLNSVFSPAIVWEKLVCEYDGYKIGIIEVKEADEKPIISHKNGQEIKEGDILYRYTGQTEKIRYPELKSIIEKEKRKYGERLLNGLKMIVEKGPDTVKLLDLDELKDLRGGKLYVIDSKPSDLEVKVREVSESGTSDDIGLKIISIEGKAIPIPVTEFANISSELIVYSFLDRELPRNHDPRGFVERLPYETSGLVPVYFFIKKASMSIEEALQIIKKAKSTTRGRSTLINRLTGAEYNFGFQTNSNILEPLVNGRKNSNEIRTPEIKYILQAIRSVSKDYLEHNWPKIKEIIRYIYENYYMNPKLRLDLRMAICYCDKTLFL